MILNLRYARRVSDIMLVLNLLLRTGVRSPSNRGRHHWVWAPTGSDPPTIWAGEGYMIPNFQWVVEDLPTTAGMAPLVEVDAQAYYDRLGASDTLTIPSELTTLFDLFYSLTGEKRERFLRACFWYRMASIVWDYSQSLYLMSLVNAVECLAGIGGTEPAPRVVAALIRTLTRRPAQPPKPTSLFLNFMKGFAPGRPSRKKLDDLYEARSEITHGERLLHLDQASRPIGLSQTSATDWEVGDNASLLIRGALINWLWSHGPQGTGHLITTGIPTTKPPRPGTKSRAKVITPGA
jgi:hypothetical protein